MSKIAFKSKLGTSSKVAVFFSLDEPGGQYIQVHSLDVIPSVGDIIILAEYDAEKEFRVKHVIHKIMGGSVVEREGKEYEVPLNDQGMRVLDHTEQCISIDLEAM